MEPHQPQNMPGDPYQNPYGQPPIPPQPAYLPPQPPAPPQPSLPQYNASYEHVQPVQPNNEAPQPVAYDQYGNPLYAHPPQPTQFVHVSRAIQPLQEEIPPEIMQRYEDSRRRFPSLNLSKGEYVISAVRRHPIGLIKIWSIAVMLILAFMALLLGFFMNQGGATATALGSDSGTFMTIGVAIIIVLSLFTLLGGFIATYVYNSNHFYLTNESVVQEIQTSLFAKREQTVSLSNIEDASYKQGGLLQSFLNYGTIRLSTEGDETTYRFTYVSNPKRHIAILNNAVEAFKNGRPVDPSTADQPS